VLAPVALISSALIMLVLLLELLSHLLPSLIEVILFLITQFQPSKSTKLLFIQYRKKP
jgi:hypothetical protein